MKKFEVYGHADAKGKAPFLGTVFANDRGEAMEKARAKWGNAVAYLYP